MREEDLDSCVEYIKFNQYTKEELIYLISKLQDEIAKMGE